MNLSLTRASWLFILLLCTAAGFAADGQSLHAPVSAQAEAEPRSAFRTMVKELASANYRAKKAIAGRIAQSGHPRARTVLVALLEGELRASEADGRVFITPQAADEPLVIDLESGEALDMVAADSLDRIRTNNALRKALKGLIAQLDLHDPSPAVRLAAVEESRRTLDDDTVAALRQRLADENNSKVQGAIQIALALRDIRDPDAAVRLEAVKRLDGELMPAAYNQLTRLTAVNENGEPAEADAAVREAAAAAIANIEFWRGVCGAFETLFFGLSLGSVLVLAAIGLAITFGVMGVINMAHGELIMLGAYTTYVMQLLLPESPGVAVLLSIPAAFVVSGLFGVAIERGVCRFLYGRPLETLLATFGISLILQQLVRSMFSPNNRPITIPDFLSGVWQVNDALALTYNRLYILLFSLMVFGVLLMVLKQTPLGLKVRAVSQNRPMARAMGVRAHWVDAATFGLGAGIAGIAGVALSQLTNVGPNLGQAYIIDSFMVVVFGGVGNLWGTLIGGMSLGVINKLLEPFAGAVLAKILVLVALILFIQRRPSGLFPQKGRAAEGH
ncbi:MAG: urea ABC transporter permease subunit UrtB [Panacagrimonas sp.]